MIDCEEFAENVSEYLDGRVPYGKRIGMWMHAVICKPCRIYCDQVEKVVEWTGELGERREDETPPDEMCDELLEKYRCSNDD